MTPLSPTALHGLAELLEAAPSPRDALLGWAEVTGEAELRRCLEKVSARLRLGSPVPVALRPLVEVTGDDADALARIIDVHADFGGGAAAAVRRLASAIESRDRMIQRGRAASSAARLSGRMMAAIACGAVLLFGWGSSPLAVATTLACGGALGLGGRAWMRRLAPRAPVQDPPVALLAESIARLAAAGLPLSTAIDAATRTTPVELAADVARVRRRVHLGQPWPAALANATSGALRDLAEILRRSARLGVSPGTALYTFADSVRERQRCRFDLAARRAPVLLVLPLTLCFLPAFCIVVVVPMLRAVAS